MINWNRINTRFIFRTGLFVSCLIAITCYTPTSYAATYQIGATSGTNHPIRAFSLTGLTGQFQQQFNFNQYHHENSGLTTTDSRQFTASTLVDVALESYVYHPYFLRMEMGIGGEYLNDRIDELDFSEQGQDLAPNYFARLSFMEQKDYPFQIEYSYSHPVTYANNPDMVESDLSRIGFNLRLMQPLLPIEIRTTASHRSSQVTSIKRKVQETEDYFTLAGTKSFNEKNQFDFTYFLRQSESNSSYLGNVFAVSKESHDFRINSHHSLGKKKENVFAQKLNLLSGSNSGRKDSSITYRGQLDWHFSERIATQSALDIARRSGTGGDSRSVSAIAGISFNPTSELSLNGGISTSKEQGSQLTNSKTAATGAVGYNTQTPIGELRLRAQLEFENEARVVSDRILEESGEIVVLNDGVPVPLVHEDPVVGSIQVTNPSGSIIYEEGVDYRLVPFNRRIEIEKLTFGIIEDGESVLVAYDYQVKGSGDFDRQTQNYSINYLPLDWLSVNVLYDKTDYVIHDEVESLGLMPRDRVNIRLKLGDFTVTPLLSIGANLGGETNVMGETHSNSYTADAYSYLRIPSVRSTLQFAIGKSSRETIAPNVNDYRIDNEYMDFSFVSYLRPYLQLSGGMRLERELVDFRSALRQEGRAQLTMKFGKLYIDTVMRYAENDIESMISSRFSVISKITRKF